MANEFIIRKGYKSLASSEVTGSLTLIGDYESIRALTINSTKGSGTEHYFRTHGVNGDTLAIYSGGNRVLSIDSNSIDVLGSISGSTYYGDGSNLTGISIDGGNATTLDSLDSTQFLRSDAADTAAGAITFSEDITLNVAKLLKSSNNPTSNFLDFDDDSTTHNPDTNVTTLASVSGLALATNLNDGGGGNFTVSTGASGTELLRITTAGNATIAGNLDVDGTGTSTFAGTVTAATSFIADAVSTSNNDPGSDNVQVSGYGLIGNRGAVYLTNANSSGNVQIGVGGAHNNSPKLVVGATTSTFYTNVVPQADSTYSLGNTSLRWSVGYFDSLQITNVVTNKILKFDGTDIDDSIMSDDGTTVSVAGDMTVTGTLTAQEFHTEFVSASIIYESGSTKFGDTVDDNHDFTGSLSILANSGATGIQLERNASTYININNSSTRNEFNFKSTNGLRFYYGTDSTTPLFISSSGNVGIGTTAPDSLLTIHKDNTSGQFATYRNNTGFFLHRTYADYNNDGTTVEYQERVGVDGNYTRIGNFSNHPLYLMSNNDTKVTILTDGNVGIGTTSPARDLQIKKSNSGGQVRAEVFNSSDTAGSHGVVSIYSGGASAGDAFLHYKIDGVGDWSAGIDNSDSDKYKISRNFGPGVNDYLVINTSGNVGIGVTSPSAKLGISQGAGGTAQNIINSGEVAFRFSTKVEDTSTNTPVFRQGIYYNNTENATIAFYRGGSSVGGFMTFQTQNGNERMRIDSSGNVGIGETSVDAKLHLTATSAGLINQKFESAGSAAWRLGIPASQTYFAFDNANDNLSAPKVVIDSSGNVGIGTTGPVQKLHIVDTDGANIILNSNTGAENNGIWMTEGGVATPYVNGAYVHYDSTNNVFKINTGTTSLATRFEIARDTGAVRFNDYGAGTLVSDASGNITVSSGGGAGGPYSPLNDIRSLGTTAFTAGSNPSITTAQLIGEIESDGGFDSFSSVFKTSWSYAGNYNLTDAGRFTETAGTSWLTWTDNSSDSTRGNITALAIAPTTGGSANKVFIYNDQGGDYSPGWREIWTNASDGAGSGLDADKLDGQEGTHYLDYSNFTGTPTIPTDFVSAANGGTFSGDITISKSAGDSVLTIEADTDNNNENDNPRIELKQDSGVIYGHFGINGDANATFTGAGANSTYIRAAGGLDIATNGSTKALTIDTSQNATFAGDIDALRLNMNLNYAASNEYLVIGKAQSQDGGILLKSKPTGGSAQNDWQILNHASTGDLRFYAYGLGGFALTLDREDGNATFAGRVKGVNYTSTENAAPGGFQTSRDYLIAGTGDRGGGLVINDVSGARHALYAGGHDLTFAKETDNGSGTISHDIWMRANAANSAGNVTSLEFFKDATFAGDITTSGNIYLNNNKTIFGKNTSGSNYGLLTITSGNIIKLGAYSYTSAATEIGLGDNGKFLIGTAEALSIDSSKNATFAGNVYIGTAATNGGVINLIKSSTNPEIRIQSGEGGTTAFSIYNTATNPDAEQFFINNTLSSSHLGNKRGALKLETSSGVNLTLSGTNATFAGNVTANGSILGGGNLFLRSYNDDPKGIFFRDGFEYGDTNQYNLSITVFDDGDNSADAMNINAYDGIYFNVASGTTPSTAFRVLSTEVRSYKDFTVSGNITIGGNKYNLTVNAPTSLVTSIVNDTINVTFTASTTSNIDNYLVFSSVAGGDYGLISVIPPADFGATMSIIDDSFNAGGTQAYRVYAVKNGVYSSALTGTKSFTVGTVDPTNLSVVNLNTAFYIQYDAPATKSRFITAYNIYKHEHATQSSLSRSSATLIYSGMNNSYMYQINGSNNSNFHQFWVETTVA